MQNVDEKHCRDEMCNTFRRSNDSKENELELKEEKNNFKNSIKDVLNQIHLRTGISNKALNSMNLFCNIIGKVISDKTEGDCSLESFQKILSDLLPGSLEHHAISEGKACVKRGRSSFSIDSVSSLLGCGVSDEKCIWFITGVLEYLTAEILELGGNSAINRESGKIYTRDIRSAIKKDIELSELFQNEIFKDIFN